MSDAGLTDPAATTAQLDAGFAMGINAPGEAESITRMPLGDLTPAARQVRVRVAASGVNFIDTYQRGGLYPIQLPAVLGLEGAGVVTEIGPHVSAVAVGDRVAWLDVPGSYATEVVAPASRLVKIPDGVSLATAAAGIFQATTAHYLTHDTFHVQGGHICLIHAGAGGVGQMLIQFAKAAGARVLATAGSAHKQAVARAAGADIVVGYEDFVQVANQEFGEHAVDVVFDGVGQATFVPSLDVLRPRGMMVTFGNASGPVEPISPLVLSAKGSIYLARPKLADYLADDNEFAERTTAVMTAIAGNAVRVSVGATFPLAQAAQAHQHLESRASTGKIVLLPDHTVD